MDRAAFDAYFVQNIDTMLALGAAHPNSERGRFIHAVLNLIEPRVIALEARIEELEAKPKRSKKQING